MFVGAPACGMNAAARAFVRVGLTEGYGALGIHYGFEGLVNDDVSQSRCSGFSYASSKMTMSRNSAFVRQLSIFIHTCALVNKLLVPGFCQEISHHLQFVQTLSHFQMNCTSQVC